MDCEILTVGNELLLGFVVDTNAAEMGRLLAAAGVRVRRRATVADDHADIVQAVRVALDRSGTVIVCGGLGPTKDDLTRQAVAEVFGRRLVRDPQLAAQLEDWFKRRGVPMAPDNLVQCDVPEGATILPNPRGTAAGLWLEDGHGRRAVLLPGVPKELVGLMVDEVVPRLKSARGQEGQEGPGPSVILSRTVRTAGIGEAALHEKIGNLDGALPAGLTLAWLPSTDGTELRLTAWNMPEADAAAALEQGLAVLERRAGRHAYGRDGVDLACVVLDLLAERGVKLAIAESCTGGLLGARLTAVPGCSSVLVGGVVAYDNDVKLGLLGVSADELAAHGAVSETVVRAMAEGVARSLGVQAGIGITGIAGPDGGSEAKPVGTVWIGVHLSGTTRAFQYVLPGDRADVRARAVQMALVLMRRAILGD